MVHKRSDVHREIKRNGVEGVERVAGIRVRTRVTDSCKESTALLMFIFCIYLYWEFWHKTHEMIPNDKGFWVEFAVKADLSDDPWKLECV
ncbi:hypothetical protein NC653_009960 [Populus alba x Populus x berolinensis]|uniref:Uncharacterized protein n=1 Tax=Populus alba x Populus x berolinensis TaxID=444605 RepID=A0AAD6WB42_9ROSI|nr:hypothetical protein NC653_009960 [Populus alba x Populus x berolinensis]